MKWLEIIELRSVGNNLKLLEPELKHLIEELNIESEQRAIVIYNRLAVDSDFSIHLFHDSKEADINGSSLGAHLVSTLKEFGLINHSVWIEQIGA
jgi:hypothetical protein